MARKKDEARRGKKNAPKQTKDEVHRLHQITMLKIEKRSDLAIVIAKGLLISLALYVALYLPATTAPGKTTTVTVTQNLFASFKISEVVAYLISGSMYFLWRREKAQKLKERAAKDPQIRTLEEIIDPNVSSSKLTVDGESELGEQND